jgi:2'-phosphotransferase
MGKFNQSLPAAVRISKQLTQLLRHSGRSEGLHVQPNGFTPLHDVLNLASMMKLKADEGIVREIVRTSDKQRFALLDNAGQTLIRANQGHSMEGIDMDELCGSPVSSLNAGEVCCHGTYERHLQSILRTGLKAGGNQGLAFRKDVHFSVKPPGETVISGMRQSCSIAIYVDLPRAAKDGILFYRSANNVILSAGANGTIPPLYFESVWNIQKGEQIDVTSLVDETSATAVDHMHGDESKLGPREESDELDNAIFAYSVYGCTHER